MTVFRANDRHDLDPQTLIIFDLEDFKLWRERQKLGFNTIFYKHALTPTEIQAAQTLEPFIPEVEWQTNHDQRTYNGFSSHDFTQENWKKTFDQPNQRGIQGSFYRAARKFPQAWFYAFGNDDWFFPLILRRNGQYHQFFEAHGPALSMSYIGGGTVFKNEAGEEFQADNGDLCLFNREHRAPTLSLKKRMYRKPARVGFVATATSMTLG